ncbi:unnamed protein product [Plutella xylostella]|uniref:(diamondback moth) hypothetical protein n=1 Tax=Plutella xylostella TaxID=51655 RepID=A0A8S4ECH6_PLUXY|nr:unnamed protein product [Plutella xylostella]
MKKFQSTWVNRFSEDLECLELEEEQPLATLAGVQADKMTLFFEELLDHDRDEVICDQDFDNFCEKLAHFADWSTNSSEFHILLEVKREFIEHFINELPNKWRNLPYYRRVCGPEAGGYPGRSTLEGWLARWALYLNELRRFSDLPLYLQYLCKILFHVIDREVDAGVQVDAAYFDFRKAFDTVDNDVLLNKLAAIGCTPHSLTFFSSYLDNRKHFLINDLPNIVRGATCPLFADDLKLLLRIGDEGDCDRLQGEIDRVVQWSHENKLHFNASKCMQISFSRARAPRQRQYTLAGGAALQQVTSVRDLGVRISSDVSFRDHIVDTCKSAFKILGFVLRRCHGFTDISAVKALYNALVRSKLECNAIIWAPHEAKYSLMLERIQNKFLRFIYFKLYGVYPGYPLLYPSLFVTVMVGYTTLAARRDLALATTVFKVLRGWLINPAVLENISLVVPSEDTRGLRRRAGRLLSIPPARTNLLAKAPLTRALRLLNKVNESVDLYNCSLASLRIPRPARSVFTPAHSRSRHRPAKPAQAVGAKPYSRLDHARSCAASEI